MTAPIDIPRYHRARRWLHWIIAALVLFTIPLGLAFTNFDYKGALDGALGKGAFDAGYSVHKSIGLLVLALMAARIAAKLLWPDPGHRPPLPAFNRVASHAAHRLLYVLLVVAPLLAWAGVSAYPAPLPFFGLFEAPALIGKNRPLAEALLVAHRYAVYAIMGIVAVHIAAALHHAIIRRDGVLERMLARR
ncbi:MAG: cytochrome B [Alphaproteobacteria bacterium HGW-Alphaproteobacteria-10]|nr:MAG: cytochrome B [Alphaproteobacteria bacterium HGW-Alphaproteobacteria-10]